MGEVCKICTDDISLKDWLCINTLQNQNRESAAELTALVFTSPVTNEPKLEVQIDIQGKKYMSAQAIINFCPICGRDMRKK